MSRIPLTVPTLTITFLVGYISTAQSVPDTMIRSETCGSQTYASSDPYANSVAYVFADLINVTPSQKGYDYYTSSPYPSPVAYGHATCNQTLANAYCAACFVEAHISLSSLCAPCTSGQVTMMDCSLSYQSSAYSH